MPEVTPAHHQRIGRMYDAFNARDFDALTSFLREDVNWPDGEARLRAELATCPQAPTGDGYKTYRAIVGHDQRFHDLVLELAGNDVVRGAFARTNCHLHVFRLHNGRGMGSQALAEHEAVVAAVASGRPEAAEAAMRDHLVRARVRLHDAIGAR